MCRHKLNFYIDLRAYGSGSQDIPTCSSTSCLCVDLAHACAKLEVLLSELPRVNHVVWTLLLAYPCVMHPAQKWKYTIREWSILPAERRPMETPRRFLRKSRHLFDPDSTPLFPTHVVCFQVDATAIYCLQPYPNFSIVHCARHRSQSRMLCWR